jgi:hypothetical protein
MRKEEWCLPTRELDKPRLAELVQRSAKPTESIEIPIDDLAIADGSQELLADGTTPPPYRRRARQTQVERELAAQQAAREAAVRRRRRSGIVPVLKAPLRESRAKVKIVLFLMLLASAGAYVYLRHWPIEL